MHLLLLDDSPSILSAFETPLAHAIPAAITCVLKDRQSIEELVDQISVKEPDVILMDGQLGEYHGFEVVRMLGQKLPEAACIGFSSAVSYEDPFLAAGAKGFVWKDVRDVPATVGRVVEVLRECERMAR